MLRRVLVGDNERVFLIRKGRFEEILGPGQHWISGFGVNFERHDIRNVIVQSEWTDFLVKERWELVSRYFTVVETRDQQVAVVYFDEKVSRVVAPGSRVLFWNGPVEVTYDLIDAEANPHVPAFLLPALNRLGPENACAVFAVVDEGKRGLLHIHGRLVRELSPGSYAYWNTGACPRVDIVDLRLQTIELAEQEILTRDKVTVRVNISAAYHVVDAILARSVVTDVSQHLRRTLQIAVRKALGKRSLEEVLAEKVEIAEAIVAELRQEMKGYGVRVRELAIQDIIESGDRDDTTNLLLVRCF